MVDTTPEDIMMWRMRWLGRSACIAEGRGVDGKEAGMITNGYTIYALYTHYCTRAKVPSYLALSIDDGVI